MLQTATHVDTKGHYNWETIDRLIHFVEDHEIVVKAHGLISSCCNPDYPVNITDPKAFRAEMTAHFKAVMQRYHDKVDRWDVVTEALKTQGGGLQINDFYKVLSPNYIDEAFWIARAAAPDAKLFFNEATVESLAGKRQELYKLVLKLVADGVPIDEVALEVSIAEMDVHTLNTTFQTDMYSAIVAEARDAGIADKHAYTWVDVRSR